MSVLKEYCRELRLSNLYEHIEETATEDQSEFLLALFQEEINSRKRKRITRSIQLAKFDMIKTFQDYSFEGIALPQTISVEEIQQTSFIDKKENLILYGLQGTGKTHLSIAAGISACDREKRVKFYKVASLVNDLIEAKQQGKLNTFLKSFTKLDCLILDEWGYIPIDAEGAKLLFQVVADCYEKRSVIITTNLEFGKWNGIFYDEKLTGAILDRVIHHSHLIIFNRESYRKKHSLMNQK